MLGTQGFCPFCVCNAAHKASLRVLLIFLLIFSYKQELNEVVLDVSGWWGGCVGVKKWTGDVEGRLVEEKPLAGSVDIVEEQRNTVQVSAHLTTGYSI